MAEAAESTPTVRPPERRKLIAVVYADMVGYSRLIGLDDAGTLSRLKALRADLIDPAIEKHGGRVVQTGGTSLLIVFDSIDGAMRCAVKVQQQVPVLDGDQPPDRVMRFRIGIDIGDAIADGTDLHGDTVNVAARLQAECSPGGVCVSRSVRDHVHGQLDLAFEELGLLHLKNIARPVEAFVLRPAACHDQFRRKADDTATTQSTLLAAGFGERPAIAVLPFKHRSGDPDQELFADAITEDVITALARWRHFPVIARNSVFTCKGRDVDLRSVSLQLGARYIVEGSLRKTGSRIRMSVQAIDVETMDSLLADQYEYGVDELFAAQEEIVRTIVGTIAPEVVRHEQARAVRVPPQSGGAYELYQRGMWHHYRYTREDNEKAREHFLRALEFDPNYAHASAGMAITLWNAAHAGWATDRKQFYDQAIRHARSAIQSDSRDPMAHYALGGTLLNAGFPHDGVPHLREAIELDPSHSGAHAHLAFALNFLDRPREALPEIQLALRLCPHEPRRFLWLPALAISHYLSGRYREALAACQAALVAKPDYPVAIRYLVATLGQLGRLQEARGVLPLMSKLDGDLAGSRAYIQRIFVPSATSRIVEGLQKAGLV